MSRKIVFESSAFADFKDWVKLDKKIHRKIIELIKDINGSMSSFLVEKASFV
jgi:toxin YoeB